MPLTNKQKHYLRAKSHPLKPVIIIGNHGLTDNVLAEFKLALEHHELMKVKINGADRMERQSITKTIAKQTQAEIVQSIGRVSTFFRASEPSQIELPKIR